MRARTVAVPAAVAGAIALALAPALSAAAATTEWTQPGDSWWSTATWTTTVPAAGDTVVFNGGPRSTYDLGDVTFARFEFPTSHVIANEAGAISLIAGLSVTGGSVAESETQITAIGSQTWSVESGSSLVFDPWIFTDGVGTLTLDVDGVMEINGNLDALGTGAVVQTGSGMVIRRGGAGGAILDGYTVASGEFSLDGAIITGTAVRTTGGALTGVGQIGALTVVDGALAPGDPVSDPYGTIGVEGDLALDGGIELVDIDPVAADNDYVITRGVLSGVGTTLLPITTSTPAVGQVFAVVGAWSEGSVDPGFRFLSPGGAVLDNGAEFVMGTQRWSIQYTTGAGGVVEITYLGEVPPTPALPATGQENAWLLPVALIAGGLVVVGVVIVIVRAVRSRRSGTP